MKRETCLAVFITAVVFWNAEGHSEDSPARKRAEAKVYYYFSVKFETGSAIGPVAGKSAEDYTKSLMRVARAVKENKAIMMYFYVVADENEKDEGLKARAERCAALNQDLFSGEEKVQELGLLARSCERCKVDVSRTKAKDNPYYNSETAPVVVVVAGNGGIVATLTGNSVTADSVTKALSDALLKSGIDAKIISVNLKRNGRTLLSLETKKATLDQEIADAEKKISEWKRDKDKVKDAVKLEKGKKAKEEELSKVKQDIADIHKTLEAAPEVKGLKK